MSRRLCWCFNCASLGRFYALSGIFAGCLSAIFLCVLAGRLCAVFFGFFNGRLDLLTHIAFAVTFTRVHLGAGFPDLFAHGLLLHFLGAEKFLQSGYVGVGRIVLAGFNKSEHFFALELASIR